MTELAPRVSVVVATYARPRELHRCLDALAAQTLPAGLFEVVVVDDGSPQPAVAPSRLSNGTPVILSRQIHAGPAAARNRGIAQAHGDYVAFVDDDCIPERGWLQALLAALEAGRGVGAGGSVVNLLGSNPCSQASQDIVSFIAAYYNGDPTDARFFTSNNMAFPREALIAAGAFSATYQRAAAEDRELCNRWRALGHRLVTADAARVGHAHALTFRGFWRQHYSYGRGARQFRHSLAARGGDRVRVEPLGFYLGLMTWPVRRRGPRGVVQSALIGVAQVANAMGFVAEMARDWRTPAVTSPAPR